MCNISLKHFEDLNLVYYIVLVNAGIYYHCILVQLHYADYTGENRESWDEQCLLFIRCKIGQNLLVLFPGKMLCKKMYSDYCSEISKKGRCCDASLLGVCFRLRPQNSSIGLHLMLTMLLILFSVCAYISPFNAHSSPQRGVFCFTCFPS